MDITAHGYRTFLQTHINSLNRSNGLPRRRRPTMRRRKIKTQHIPRVGRWTRPATPLAPTADTRLEFQQSTALVRIRPRETHPITQSPHILLRELFASHQILNPAIEGRNRPRIGRRRKVVWFWRTRRVNLHIIIHCGERGGSWRAEENQGNGCRGGVG